MEIPLHRLKIIIPERPSPSSSFSEPHASRSPPVSLVPEPDIHLDDEDLALLCALRGVYEHDPDPDEEVPDSQASSTPKPGIRLSDDDIALLHALSIIQEEETESGSAGIDVPGAPSAIREDEEPEADDGMQDTHSARPHDRKPSRGEKCDYNTKDKASF